MATLHKKNIRYKAYNPHVNDLQFKIKRDVPGENFDAWKEVMGNDRPKGIILVLDLYGIWVDNALQVKSDTAFRDLDVKDDNGNRAVRNITPKDKFRLHVDSFRTIHSACVDSGIKVKGMSVFLNKCDKWISRGSDETELIYLFKKAIKQRIDLLEFTKDLGMKEDISWAVTSLDKDYRMKYLEPALTRYASKFKGRSRER